MPRLCLPRVRLRRGRQASGRGRGSLNAAATSRWCRRRQNAAWQWSADKLSDLNSFFKHPKGAERVIGTYFYPICLFGIPNPTDPYAATEVIADVTVDALHILVTRMSGLFVRLPSSLSDPHQKDFGESVDDVQAKLAFEEEAARAFNSIICEFCLRGVVSQPTSPVHISYAQIIDGHILIIGAVSGREVYWERTSAPALALLGPQWLSWHIHTESVIEQGTALACSGKLASISTTVPELVAGAYSLYSQRQVNEALIDGWIVCEQLLDHRWQEYCAGITDPSRKERLGDARTYSAAVRLEVLRIAGVLPEPLYQALHRARDHRNKLAHRARSSLEAASDCMNAMKMMLEDVLGQQIEAPEVLRGVNW